MRHFSIRRILVIAGLLSQGVIFAVLWEKMITTPTERTGADFISFFAATRIFQTDSTDHIYIPAYQQAIEQEEVGFRLAPDQVLLFNHMPYFLPILSVIVDANYVNSFIRWVILLLVFLVIDAVLLARLLPAESFQRGEILIATTGALLFFPIFTSILNGQDTVFLLLGMILWMDGLLNNKDILAGLGLSLVTTRPQLALTLALPLLFIKERRRVWWWFLIGTILLGVISLIILGWDGTRNFVNFFFISAGGQWYGLHPEDMPTLSGLIHRMAPGGNIQVTQEISWGIYLIALAGLCFYFWKIRRIGEQQIGLIVLIGIIIVPYLHYHDIACLLIPVFCLVRLLSRWNFLEPKNSTLLPLAISLVFLFGFFEISIRYIVVHIVMIGVACFLTVPEYLFRIFNIQKNIP